MADAMPHGAVGRVLVTGGVRSGKSRHAERLFDSVEHVTYVAAGPRYDDPDWLARIEAHQARRPGAWTTVETTDLAAALATPGPVLVDCLGTWITAVIDDARLWEASTTEVEAHARKHLGAVVDALTGRPDPTVLVSNEVGFGVVPDYRSGRLFRDLLGTVNQEVAAVCDEVHLVVAGRVLRL
jgi:adenosylcobinamide kinase/adenosylcobinamide-phosphate guanylyltransferase